MSGFSRDSSRISTSSYEQKTEELRQNQRPEEQRRVHSLSHQLSAAQPEAFESTPSDLRFTEVIVTVGPKRPPEITVAGRLGRGDRKNGSKDTREKTVLKGRRDQDRRAKRLKNGCQGAPPSGVSGVMGGPRVLGCFTASKDSLRTRPNIA